MLNKVECMDLHGGNIYRFIEEQNIEMNSVIDFSASINPLGVPKTVVKKIKESIKYLPHYPDPDAKELTKTIAGHFDIDPSSILCGNGSTELIYLVVRALRPRRVLIPMPTFSEYERACRTTGHKLKITSYKLKKENNFDINPDEFISLLATQHSSLPIDMAFLCNPNNPTGRLIKKEDVLKIAKAAKEYKCYFVIDEAFIDFVPEESVIKEVQNNPYLIVLRSMTKFYALSGLRIGYGIFPENILDAIKRHKEPWTVNTLAQVAGITAIKDREYIDQTFMVIKREKKRLEEGFKSIGITYFPSDANFYLLRHKKAHEIALNLKKASIVVRDCSNFKGLDSSYIRIAVKSQKENERLLKGVIKICQLLL
jgi:threonine-phosphate decarboxylase